MPEIYRVLGQVAPAGNIGTESNLCVVPAQGNFIISTITVCNRGTTSATFRIAVVPDGVASSAVHYIYYDASIGPKVTVAVTIGITMDAADVVRVASSTADLSFTAFGTEVTP